MHACITACEYIYTYIYTFIHMYAHTCSLSCVIFSESLEEVAELLSDISSVALQSLQILFKSLLFYIIGTDREESENNEIGDIKKIKFPF
jgi:hypothetical protein